MASNALSPEAMTAPERIAKAADLIAMGILRAHCRGIRGPFASREKGRNSLAIGARTSLYVTAGPRLEAGGTTTTTATAPPAYNLQPPG